MEPKSVTAGVNRDAVVTWSALSAATTSRYSGSPMAPGSLVRSRTLIVLTVSGIASIRCLCENGRYRRTLIRPTFVAVRIDIIDGLFDGVTHRTHCNDNVLCVRSAVVVEQLVVGADLGVDFVHVLLYDCGNRVIVGVAGLTSLEEDVGVLSGTTQNRMFRVERTACGTL